MKDLNEIIVRAGKADTLPKRKSFRRAPSVDYETLFSAVEEGGYLQVKLAESTVRDHLRAYKKADEPRFTELKVRGIPRLDKDGNPVLNDKGNVVKDTHIVWVVADDDEGAEEGA